MLSNIKRLDQNLKIRFDSTINWTNLLQEVVISDARFCDFPFWSWRSRKFLGMMTRSLGRRRWTVKQKQEYAHFLSFGRPYLSTRGKRVAGDVGLLLLKPVRSESGRMELYIPEYVTLSVNRYFLMVTSHPSQGRNPINMMYLSMNVRSRPLRISDSMDIIHQKSIIDFYLLTAWSTYPFLAPFYSRFINSIPFPSSSPSEKDH